MPSRQGEQMGIPAEWFRARWVAFAVIALGIGLRMVAATRGHNYDVDSYMIVADIVERGGNVYAETTRYNYGPVWLNILSAIHQAASVFPSIQDYLFRYLLTGFLSLVDTAIFAVLWKKVGRGAAYLFFLNPISIIITGYHSQFDNLAMLLGLLAVVIFGDCFDKRLDSRKLAGLLILGLSLMTKHVLFAFPFWLAVKQKGLSNKLAIVIIPTLVFLLGFIPYWHGGQQGIVQNVFKYEGGWLGPIFFRVFIPELLRRFVSARMVWLALLAVFAVVCRPQSALNSLLAYTCVLVAASPTMANQYLAIVIPYIAANPNPFFLSYTIIGTWLLFVSEAGLHISALQSIDRINQLIYYVLLVELLLFGFLWSMWRPGILALLRKVMDERKTGRGSR
jgi:hypothetical protein